MDPSILEFVGVEIIGVIVPVSICMFLVVIIVYTLSPANPISSSPPIRTAANLIYDETPSDSTAVKLEGALLNAFVFVILIAAVTFLLVLLYYYNYTGFLKNYTRLSAFVVLGFMGGSLSSTIIQHFSIPLDSITFSIALFNFTLVGVTSIFSSGFPILLRQTYLVILGIIVATWFTKLPEWTTWTLLIALAIYDLVAVLAPRGPLKLLVELAQSREEEIPALVYEARPAYSGRASRSLEVMLAGVVNSSEVEMQRVNEGSSSTGEDGGLLEDEVSPLVERETEREIKGRGIKLGLGDFIFYSVLVGRAAMYDMMTVYSCYVGIVSGLGCTLILLSVRRSALPALPISIALGVVFYFLTRLFMEPFVVSTSTNLVFL